MYTLSLVNTFLFQSTLPYGSDMIAQQLTDVTSNFNPRSLTGATSVDADGTLTWTFQSTLPYGSDSTNPIQNKAVKISIHAPLRERLNLLTHHSSFARYFNPRSLTGATMIYGQIMTCQDISIHAPLRERLTPFDNLSMVHHFNPRSLTGATVAAAPIATQRAISIHAPLRERLFKIRLVSD